MKTKVLEGAPYKDSILRIVKDEIVYLENKYDNRPGIVFIAVTGYEKITKYTIQLHVKQAEELGFHTELKTFESTVSENELFNLIDRLNIDDAVDAIVLLQPLPPHLNSVSIINRITPEKEVEGFHPQHMLSILTSNTLKSVYPMCLPTALQILFSKNRIRLKEGQEWLFVADDEFFKNPFTAMIVRSASAAVVPCGCPLTIVNSNSNWLPVYCKKADFLVVISKKPGFLNPEWLTRGVCIVDVYSNLVKEVPGKKDATKLIPVIKGGVNVEAVKNIARIISPVPGGLMPLVLAILFQNTLISFKKRIGIEVGS